MGTDRGGSAAPAALLDSVLEAPALVVGGLPPEARDLDLLVVPAQQGAVTAALAAAGFAGDGAGAWQRHGTAEAVDVMLPGESSIPVEEAGWLLADARPLQGYQHLVRPSPAAVLLLLAVRYGDRRGLARPAHATRVRTALADDPRAVAQARDRAPAWHVERALPTLLAEVGKGRRPGPVGRYALVREQQQRDGAAESLPRSRAAMRAVLRR